MWGERAEESKIMTKCPILVNSDVTDRNREYNSGFHGKIYVQVAVSKLICSDLFGYLGQVKKNDMWIDLSSTLYYYALTLESKVARHDHCVYFTTKWRNVK